MKMKLLYVPTVMAVMSAVVNVGLTAARWTTTGPHRLNLNGKMFTLSLNRGGISFYPPYYRPYTTAYPSHRYINRQYATAQPHNPFHLYPTRPYSPFRPYHARPHTPFRLYPTRPYTPFRPYHARPHTPFRLYPTRPHTPLRPYPTRPYVPSHRFLTTTRPYTTTTRPYTTTTRPYTTTTRPYHTTTTRPYPTTTRWYTTRPYPTRHYTTYPPWTSPPPTRGVSVCLRFLTDYQQTTKPTIFKLSPSSGAPLTLGTSYGTQFFLSFDGYSYSYLNLQPNLRFWSNVGQDIWTRVCLTVDSRKKVAQVFSGSSISIRKMLPVQYVWQGEPVIDFPGFDGQLTDVQVWDYPLGYKEVFNYMTSGVYAPYRGSVLTWSSISYSPRGNTLLEDAYEWQAKQPISSRGRGRQPEFPSVGERKARERQKL
ncbi:uncharacterized protein LOC121614328 [Chelmon rostratus]|uniref:uncharacterized protein LOC121614328 n=1 Tax=Chelmon rostratus TaxID=109905 RepID=UPI001BEC01B0|nr:uncharacterized protein LOC121614328 [Chelmon rostratus]